MMILCGNCQTRYQLPEENIRDSEDSVRCKNCGMVIAVNTPLKKTKPEAERPSASDSSSSPEEHSGLIEKASILDTELEDSISVFNQDLSIPFSEAEGFDSEPELEDSISLFKNRNIAMNLSR